MENNLRDGGRVAARGFQYQYLRTLESLLDSLELPSAHAIRIEGPTDSSHDVNAIDFDIIDRGKRSLLAAQVKSKSAGSSIHIGEVLSGIIPLIKSQDASSYQLLTNGTPTQSAEQLSVMLAKEASTGSLRTGLAKLLSAAPARLAQVRNLTSDQMVRLTRCRLCFDDRDDSEIRTTLRERLRIYRNSERQGLGDRSAGMLTGYLVAEILRRAADPASAEFEISHLRELLLVDPSQLSRLTGVRDWGVIVGPVPAAPDVARSALLSDIKTALQAPGYPRVTKVALVGLSGIGKSSLAAAYIYDQADSYDCIFWVDAESHESLLGAFGSVLKYLRNLADNGPYGNQAGYIRNEVHIELSRLPGRWLIVFDNITDRRESDTWIPRAGNGDVILTSVDSTARHGSARIMHIGTMSVPESVELLRRRLSLSEAEAEACSSQLSYLAESLSNWPLAIELAAGYMDACGIALDDVDLYLDQLKPAALADDQSLPPGYPRTIAAALQLSINQLRYRGMADGDAAGTASVAIQMLVGAAFTASRQIPVHMLAAAFLMDATEEVAGVWHVDPDFVNLGEAVREIRRFSLVTFDDGVPPIPFGHPLPIVDANRTIAVNTVVQEVIRGEYDAEQDVGWLDNLADHVQRWLLQALELNLFDRAAIIFTHADALSKYLRERDIPGKHIALLYGNLAGAQAAQGNIGTSEDLLHAELAIVNEGLYENYLLEFQCKLMLAQLYANSPHESRSSRTEILMFLAEAFDYLEGTGTDHRDMTVRFCLDIKTVLDRIMADSGKQKEFDSFRQKFDELSRRLGSTPYSELVGSIAVADSLLSEDQPKEAEQLSLHVIEANALTGQYELEARRIYVESLARQRKWTAARGFHDEFRSLFGAADFHATLITKYAHNVGFQAACAWLIERDKEAGDLLTELFLWHVLDDLQSEPAAGTPSRMRLLQAVLSLLADDLGAAHLAMRTVKPSSLYEGSATETHAWRVLWQLTSLAVFRAVYQSITK